MVKVWRIVRPQLLDRFSEKQIIFSKYHKTKLLLWMKCQIYCHYRQVIVINKFALCIFYKKSPDHRNYDFVICWFIIVDSYHYRQVLLHIYSGTHLRISCLMIFFSSLSILYQWARYFIKTFLLKKFDSLSHLKNLTAFHCIYNYQKR